MRVGRATAATCCLMLTVVLTASTPQLRPAESNNMRIVFHGYINGQPRTGTAIIDGGRLRNVADLPFLRNGGELSPDGTRVAFDTCARADRVIAIAPLDGVDVQRIVGLSGDSCVPVRWSPDGTRLSYANRADMRLHVVQVDSGIDTPLYDTSAAFGWHSWSPAGDEIAYESGRGGSRRIDVIDLASSEIRHLVGVAQFGECEVWAPAWSPSGDRIAFTSCDGKLHIVNADGSDVRFVAPSAYAPRWSVDGNSLLFLTGTSLRRVAADGGSVDYLGNLRYRGGPFSLGPVQP
jgi:TolB protein